MLSCNIQPDCNRPVCAVDFWETADDIAKLCVTKSYHLPVTGNCNVVPMRNIIICFVEISRSLFQTLGPEKLQLPFKDRKNGDCLNGVFAASSAELNGAIGTCGRTWFKPVAEGSRHSCLSGEKTPANKLVQQKIIVKNILKPHLQMGIKIAHGIDFRINEQMICC
jgi:hypothetical protein